MRRTARTALCVGLFLLGCQGTSGPSTSSETHWVQCTTHTKCRAYDPAASCVKGFCEDALGNRIAEDAPLWMSVSDGSANVEGSDKSDAAVAQPRLDAAALRCTTAPDRAAAASVHEGSFLITDEASIEAGSELTEITADLEIGARGVDQVKDVALPRLERLGGSIRLSGAAIARLQLPNLRFVGGDIEVTAASALTETDLRQLTTVIGDVSFGNNVSHQRLRLDSLAEVGGSLSVTDPNLARCEITPVFERLGLPAPASAFADCTCSLACEWLETQCP